MSNSEPSDHPSQLYRIAELLISKGYRYIEKRQVAGIARSHKTTPDAVRQAAILADRLRRVRQVQQFSPAFRIDNLVAADAPLTLVI